MKFPPQSSGPRLRREASGQAHPQSVAKKAVLIISHGSRISKTKKELQGLAKKLRSLTGFTLVEYAFLEIESPSIPLGISHCVRKGAAEIIILLNFLNAGRHVDMDIPRIVEEAAAKFPKVKIRLTKPVGQHSGILKLFVKMLSPFQK